ncbi:MAG: glycosyltransferase family 2 protein [Chloroflexi bacterium]|nr:MAG: glycosyltransferase family 2 protein [Chloroflexota bacterium]
MGAVARDVIEIEHVRWRRRPADTDDDAREDARVLEPYLPQQDRRASFYLTVRQRFAISTAGALSWMAISTALAVPWSDELASLLGAPAAWLLITLIALVPGFLNTHLVLSLLLDRPRQLDEIGELPAVTVLIAAWNERDSLPDTIRAFSRLSYPGRCELLIVDDGSTDGTIDALDEVLDLLPRARLVAAEHGGKAAALNLGLAQVRTPVVVTMDADTCLHPEALRRLVTRLVTAPPDTAAVAGMVLTRNSRANLLTRMQEWDYFLAMASVKRQQALYQGTLVAQGAFSAYKTEALRAAGGWPVCVGEDIVLTWAFQKKGFRIGFEPTAVAFTAVPLEWRRFVRQRRRWARGMIEGLAAHGDLLWRKPRLTGFFVAIDALFPLLDGAYTLVFLPGLALALFGHYYIAGPLTLLVVPISLLVTMAMMQRQSAVFRQLGLRVRRNRLGYVAYLITYQAVLSPIALLGYAQEFLRLPKRW